MNAVMTRHSGSVGAGPPSFQSRLGVAPGTHRDLRDRVVESLLALTTSTAIGEVANVIATLLLARILAPADFGAISVGLLVIGALTVLRNAFVFQTLIHRADRVREAADQMVVLSAAMGVVLCGLAWAGAGALASFFHSPASATVLRLMAVAFLINTIGVVPDTLFEKELRFRRKMWLESARPLITAVVSVLLAAAGVGPASVGWAWVAAYSVWTVGLYWLSDYSPRPRWDPKLLGDLLNYGRYVLGGAVLIFFFTNLDNASIGRLLGARALGYYSFAFLLAYYPAQVITGGVVSSVLLPVYAKLQGQREAQARSLQVTLRWVSYYAAPICVGTIVLGPPALSLVYGTKWVPAFLPLQILAVYGCAHSYFQVIRNLCNGVGRAREVWWISGLQLAIVVPLLIPAPLRFGITGTSLVFSGAKVVATGVAFAYVAHLVGARLPSLVRPLALPLGMALLAAAVAYLLGRALQGHARMHRWLPVLGEAGIFGLVYLCLSAVALRAQVAEALARHRWTPTNATRMPPAESPAASLAGASKAWHRQPHMCSLPRNLLRHALILGISCALTVLPKRPAARHTAPRPSTAGCTTRIPSRQGPDTTTSGAGAAAARQQRLTATAFLLARTTLVYVIIFLLAPGATVRAARRAGIRRASHVREE